MDRGQTLLAVRRGAGDPLDPKEIAVSGRVVARGTERRGHRVGERPLGSWMDADLGRKLGIGDERGHRPFGQLRSLGDGRHRVADVACGEVQDPAPHLASLGERWLTRALTGSGRSRTNVCAHDPIRVISLAIPTRARWFILERSVTASKEPRDSGLGSVVDRRRVPCLGHVRLERPPGAPHRGRPRSRRVVERPG